MESFELFCERLLIDEFEAILEYDTKDAKRIDDFFKKSGGDMVKVVKLANQMSKSITKKEKAFNRAEAAIDIMNTGTGPNPVADIFFARANELGYDPDKIPASIPASPKTASVDDLETDIKTPEKTETSSPKQPTPVKLKPEPEVEIEGWKEYEERRNVPSSKPASLLPTSDQHQSYANPKTVPGPQGAGTPIEYVGPLVIDKSKCAGKKLLAEEGVVEVWKLNDDNHVFIFNTENTPSVMLETPCGFLDALNGKKYLFYAELVDYIDTIDMVALIDIYGNKVKAYKYE